MGNRKNLNCKGDPMLNKALVIIDIQNDITKNYKEIIDNTNSSVGLTLSLLAQEIQHDQKDEGRSQ